MLGQVGLRVRLGQKLEDVEHPPAVVITTDDSKPNHLQARVSIVAQRIKIKQESFKR